MRKAFLALQYPSTKEGRMVVIAATRNLKALQAFKEAVLEDARLDVMDWEAGDEVLGLQNTMELERLEKLLEKLIPE